MTSSDLAGIATGHPPTSTDLSRDVSAPLQDRCATAPYRRIVLELMAERDIHVPDKDALTTIVASALESRDLYFVAALEKPDARNLARHFRSFVLDCILQTLEGSLP